MTQPKTPGQAARSPGQAISDELDRQAEDQERTDWDYDLLAQAAIDAAIDAAKASEHKHRSILIETTAGDYFACACGQRFNLVGEKI